MPEAVPPNQGYMIAAYAVAAVIIIAYTIFLFRRAPKV
jgi:hypothetical protein